MITPLTELHGKPGREPLNALKALRRDGRRLRSGGVRNGAESGPTTAKSSETDNVGSLPSSTNFLPNCVVASRATVSEETSEPIVAGIIVARKWRRNSLKRLNPRPEMV